MSQTSLHTAHTLSCVLLSVFFSRANFSSVVVARLARSCDHYRMRARPARTGWFPACEISEPVVCTRKALIIIAWCHMLDGTGCISKHCVQFAILQTITTTNCYYTPLSTGIYGRRVSFFYISKSKTFGPEISLVRFELPSLILALSFGTSHKLRLPLSRTRC